MKRINLLTLAGILLLFAQCTQTVTYKDPTAPIDRRVGDLLSRMTLEEKAAQLDMLSAKDILDKAQRIDGFGGCFNEMGWDVLMTLPASQRDGILDELFSPAQSNFTYCRLPIGANDYSLNYYSLNDVADDYGMVNFNINRDRYILIPYIKEALRRNPHIKLFASPWCPPAWMKTNNHYAVQPSMIPKQPNTSKA